MLPSSTQSTRALSAFFFFFFHMKLNSNPSPDQSLENNSGTLMLGAVPCCLTFRSLPFFSWLQTWLWRVSCIWILVHNSGCFLKVGFIGERMTCLCAFFNEPAHIGEEMGEISISLICVFPCFLSSFYVALSALLKTHIFQEHIRLCYHPTCQPAHSGFCLLLCISTQRLSKQSGFYKGLSLHS